VRSATLGRALFACLRLMDEEAGAKWGLEDYGRFLRPELKRPSHEAAWVRRVSELLRHDSVATLLDARYPAAPRNRCGLRLTLPDGARVWIETKGAWKTYWALKRKLWVYRSLLFHPLLPGLDRRKRHTAALDVARLATLSRRDADHAAFLLVGFDDGLHPMTRDVDEFTRLAGLDGWSTSATSWPCMRRLGHQVRLWYWSRPAL